VEGDRGLKRGHKALEGDEGEGRREDKGSQREQSAIGDRGRRGP
jgi:hypothetical protein